MKSLKRTLSLVLALVMVLGLFGGISMTAAATDFTDDETIQYKEAVDVVTGIGAINGYKENGEFVFKPGDNITRAEAAKMVAYTAITAQAGELLTGVTSSFSDVDATKFKWAIPSIEYLVKEGAINGVGGSKFEPNENITGFQVLKMLLCVLGYGEKKEYVGTGWDLQVAIDAANNKLTKGLEKSTKLDAPATREQLALYCFNALNAPVVTLSPISGTYTPDDSNTTLGQKVYDMDVVEGVVVDNKAVNPEATGTLLVAGNGASILCDIDTDLNLVGHYVWAYVDQSTVGKAKVEAYSVVDKSNIVEVEKAITTPAGWNKAFGTTAQMLNDDETRWVWYVDGSYGVKTGLEAGGSPANDSEEAIGGLTNRSAAPVGKYVIGAEGDLKGAVITYIADAVYTPGVVTAYKAPTATSTGKITISAPALTVIIPKTGDTESADAKTYANYKIYDGIAKDDVVTVAVTGGYTDISKAELKDTGKVTASNSNARTAVVNGNTYKVHGSAITTTPFDALDDLVGTECAIFTGPDGKIIAAKAVEEVKASIGYVALAYQEEKDMGYGKKLTLVKLQCVGMDGTVEDYVYEAFEYSGGKFAGLVDTSLTNKEQSDIDSLVNDLNTSATPADKFKGKVISIKTKTIATAGEVLDTPAIISTPTNGAKGGATAKTDKGAATIAGVADAYLDANTKFIYVKDSAKDIKVQVLDAPRAIDDNTGYYYATSTDNKNYTVKCVFIPSAPAGEDAGKIMYIADSFTQQQKVDDPSGKGQTVYSNVAYIDGVKTDVLDTSGTAIAGFYTFTVTDGLYTLANLTSGDMNSGSGAQPFWAVTAKISNINNGMITTTGDANSKNLANAVITDDTYIVDPVYDKAYAADANTKTPNHNSLDMLEGTYISYIYKVDTTATPKKQTVVGIYYSKDFAADVELDSLDMTIAKADKTALTDTINLLTAATKTTSGDTTTYKLVFKPANLKNASAGKLTKLGSDVITITPTCDASAQLSDATKTANTPASTDAEKAGGEDVQITFTVTAENGTIHNYKVIINFFQNAAAGDTQNDIYSAT